jgi:hypothetical protein
MTLHGALSILANVSPGMEERLAALLQQVDTDPGHNPLVPFAEINSIHFARFVICPARPDAKGQPIPCRLIFTTNYDKAPNKGDAATDTPARRDPNTQTAHLKELTDQAGPGLWKIFSYCEGFSAGPYDQAALTRYMLDRSVKADTFYVGVGNRSVKQIRLENELRADIQHYLDNNQASLRTKTAKQIREEIRYFVSVNPASGWAKDPDPLSTPAYTFSQTLRLLGAILLFLLLSPILLPVLILWVLIILYQELTLPNEKCIVDKTNWESLVIRETGIVQNQFSAFGNVKPGWFRYHTMIALLRLTDFLAPYIFSKGALSGIPTVHFARWLIVSEGRQMLFLSNYDGNSEGYLRDFIDIAGKQLTLLFSHTVGYPKTWLMLFGGAKDANGFMAWARTNQLITNVWYSANPSLSVKNIFQNSKIRKGLYGNMYECQARDWLRLF